MDRFENIGVQRQYDATTIKEADWCFKGSCNSCSRTPRALWHECDRCPIAMAHEDRVAILADEMSLQQKKLEESKVIKCHNYDDYDKSSKMAVALCYIDHSVKEAELIEFLSSLADEILKNNN